MFLNRLFCLGDAVVKLFPIGSLTLTIQSSGMCPMGIRVDTGPGSRSLKPDGSQYLYRSSQTENAMPDPEFKTWSASVVESKAGKIAVVIQRGTGFNSGSRIWEINKDRTPSKKEPYWISIRSDNWHSKGRCVIHYRNLGKIDEYYFTDFELFETKAPHNPDGREFTYVVEVIQTKSLGWFKSEEEIVEITVKAISGEVAKTKIAANPESYGLKSEPLMVRGARPFYQ